jgi:hypothetical protein
MSHFLETLVLPGISSVSKCQEHMNRGGGGEARQAVLTTATRFAGAVSYGGAEIPFGSCVKIDMIVEVSHSDSECQV